MPHALSTFLAVTLIGCGPKPTFTIEVVNGPLTATSATTHSKWTVGGGFDIGGDDSASGSAVIEGDTMTMQPVRSWYAAVNGLPLQSFRVAAGGAGAQFWSAASDGVCEETVGTGSVTARVLRPVPMCVAFDRATTSDVALTIDAAAQNRVWLTGDDDFTSAAGEVVTLQVEGMRVPAGWPAPAEVPGFEGALEVLVTSEVMLASHVQEPEPHGQPYVMTKEDWKLLVAAPRVEGDDGAITIDGATVTWRAPHALGKWMLVPVAFAPGDTSTTFRPTRIGVY